MLATEAQDDTQYFVEQVSARNTDLTGWMNTRWDEGWRLEHMTSISWGAFVAQSSTWLVLVWTRRQEG